MPSISAEVQAQQPPLGSTVIVRRAVTTGHGLAVDTEATVTEVLSHGYDGEVIRVDGTSSYRHGATISQVLAPDEFTWEAPVQEATLAVGARVKITRDNANSADVRADDEGVIVDNDGDHTWYVKMDRRRGATACYSGRNGADYVFHNDHLKALPGIVVGSLVTVTETPAGFIGSWVGTPYARPGDALTVLALNTQSWREDHEKTTQVRLADGRTTREVFHRSLTLLAPVEETLESFKVSFLTGAIARGEKNGPTHSEQVTAALDELARLEFLEPSTDLLSFQKRVVALAMDSKRKHSWCGEPEAYLTEIGLGHLVPKRKRVTFTYTTDVFVAAGESDVDAAVRVTPDTPAGLSFRSREVTDY